MRLSIAEARALGIDERWIRLAEEAERYPTGSLGVYSMVPPPAGDPVRPKRSRSPDGMNKLERSFAEDVLAVARREGLIADWWREPFSIRLAGKTFFKPDFGVWALPHPQRFTFIDTKGHMEDDAAVKIKVAAERYPCFRWLLVYRAGRHGWDVREVTRSGIGRESIAVDWIEGDC